MTRLSNDIRRDIANKCIEVQFAIAKKEILKEEAALGMELYRSVFDAKLIAQAKRMPENWVKKDKCLRFNCAGYDLRFNLEIGVPVPYASDCSRLGNIAGDLGGKAQDFARKREKLTESIRAAHTAVLSVLESVGSLAQVEKVWPQGKPFYARYIQSVQGTNVPAIQIKELNNILGLKEAA